MTNLFRSLLFILCAYSINGFICYNDFLRQSLIQPSPALGLDEKAYNAGCIQQLEFKDNSGKFFFTNGMDIQVITAHEYMQTDHGRPLQDQDNYGFRGILDQNIFLLRSQKYRTKGYEIYSSGKQTLETQVWVSKRNVILYTCFNNKSWIYLIAPYNMKEREPTIVQNLRQYKRTEYSDKNEVTAKHVEWLREFKSWSLIIFDSQCDINQAKLLNVLDNFDLDYQDCEWGQLFTNTYFDYRSISYGSERLIYEEFPHFDETKLYEALKERISNSIIPIFEQDDDLYYKLKEEARVLPLNLGYLFLNSMKYVSDKKRLLNPYDYWKSEEVPKGTLTYGASLYMANTIKITGSITGTFEMSQHQWVESSVFCSLKLLQIDDQTSQVLLFYLYPGDMNIAVTSQAAPGEFVNGVHVANFEDVYQGTNRIKHMLTINAVVKGDPLQIADSVLQEFKTVVFEAEAEAFKKWNKAYGASKPKQLLADTEEKNLPLEKASKVGKSLKHQSKKGHLTKKRKHQMRKEGEEVMKDQV